MMMARTKRLCAPVYWPVHRKEKKYVTSVSPGPHDKKSSIPVGIILRDVFAYAETMKEAREILGAGNVKINGKPVKKPNYPAGIMDILSLSADENYIVLPGSKGLMLKRVRESNTRLAKVVNKKINHGNVIQLNLHNGTNIITKEKDISTGDTLLIDNGKFSIKSVVKMKKGSLVIVTKGRNRGKIGTMEKVIITKSSQPNQAVIKVKKESLEMPYDYLFVIGTDKAAVDMGEIDE